MTDKGWETILQERQGYQGWNEFGAFEKKWMVIPFSVEENDRPGKAAHTYNLSTKEVDSRQTLASSTPGICSKKPLKQKPKITEKLEK